MKLQPESISGSGRWWCCYNSASGAC